MNEKEGGHLMSQSGEVEKGLQEVIGIMNRLEGVSLHRKVGGHFRFRMHLTDEMYDAPVDALELSARPLNCLKRSGYDTVGKLAMAIDGGTDLKHMRGCGKDSVQMIMIRLFIYQYESMRPERREDYLREIAVMNES
jgi:DNA-directed RNA polymerase subunit alpha